MASLGRGGRGAYTLRARNASRPSWASLGRNDDALSLESATNRSIVYVGLHPTKLNPAEEAAFGSKREDYVEARNALLEKWLSDPSKPVTADAFPEHELAEKALAFLQKWGHINFGVLDGEEAPGVPTGAPVSGGGEEDEESSQDLVLEQALHALLAELNLEEAGMKVVRRLLREKLGFEVDKAKVRALVDVYVEVVHETGAPPPFPEGKKKGGAREGEGGGASESGGPKKRVLVIGAGPAGLTAARHLVRHGVEAVVLEARERVGGRVNSALCEDFSVPVDLGASIITGTAPDVDLSGQGGRRPDPSALVARQLGLQLHELGHDCPIMDGDAGLPVPKAEDERVTALWDSLLDNSSASGAADDSKEGLGSLGDALASELRRRFGKEGDEGGKEPLDERTEKVLAFHMANLEYGCSASLDEVSLQHWNQDEHFGGFGGPHAMVKGGYSQVTEGLARGLDVRLGAAVAEVRHGGDGGVVVVTAAGEELKGDAVIVTVPLGVLKAGGVKFDPALPDWKAAAVSRLGFGDLNKVMLEFPEAFWDQSLDYFGATAGRCSFGDPEETRGRCFMYWNLSRFAGAPVIAGLLSGTAARKAEEQPAEELRDAAVALLRATHPEAEVPEPVAFHVSQWAQEPFTRGSYSFVAVGSSADDYDKLAEPVGERLLFAGEHTCKEHPDTVGGAMLTGLREAVRVLHNFSGEPFVDVPIKEPVVLPEEAEEESQHAGESDEEFEVDGDEEHSEEEEPTPGGRRRRAVDDSDDSDDDLRGGRPASRGRGRVSSDSEEDDSDMEAAGRRRGKAKAKKLQGGKGKRKGKGGGNGSDLEEETDVAGAKSIWSYIRQSGIIEDADTLREWDRLDAADAAAAEKEKAEKSASKAGGKGKASAGGSKSRARSSESNEDDEDRAGASRLLAETLGRDMGRLVAGQQQREAARQQMKEMLRTITAAETGDVGPLRDVMGKCESDLFVSILKELNQTDKARRALSSDAACLRQLSARLTNAVAGSKAPGKIPLVVEMLRVLVQLPASAAGAARESGLLKALHGMRASEAFGELALKQIGTILSNWQQQRKPGAQAGGAPAHNPIRIQTMALASSSSAPKLPLPPPEQDPAPRRPQQPQPQPPRADVAKAPSGGQPSGGARGAMSGDSASTGVQSPGSPIDDPELNAMMEAARRACEMAKEAASQAAEVDKEAASSAVLVPSVGEFSYGKGKKRKSLGSSKDHKEERRRKEEKKGKEERRRSGSSKDSKRRLSDGDNRQPSSSSSRKESRKEPSKTPGHPKPSSSSQGGGSASKGDERKDLKTEAVAGLRAYVSKLLKPLYENRRIDKAMFSEIRNSSMAKIIDKQPQMRTPKDWKKFLADEKNAERVKDLVTGYINKYEVRKKSG